MSASGWLTAAKFGVDVLSAYGKYSAKAAGAETAETAAEMQGEMERYQTKRQARNLAEERRRRFADFMGAQRASQATAGITGGRTGSMVEAESQNQFSRQEQEQEASTEMRLETNRRRERMQRIQSRFQKGAAERQLGIDIFNAALDAGKSGVKASQASAAASGGGGAGAAGA